MGDAHAGARMREAQGDAHAGARTQSYAGRLLLSSEMIKKVLECGKKYTRLVKL